MDEGTDGQPTKSPHRCGFFVGRLVFARSAVHQSSATINHQPSTISHQPSTINHQPSTINHQPSTISHQPSAIGHQQRPTYQLSRA
ncbi:hypothetical protein VDP85_14595 [Xanthomonas campestris pv. campestris]|uniref:hypothetical protein n=1 Tax=Xanthomonas campestris TaxID=339 RepID=UPI002B3A1E12|nr:hypothetical protein [Xanthomonas campestris pv. campestris]MEB1290117.1 hypothetical protein [Xanthomonas campestris pv. campestris]